MNQAPLFSVVIPTHSRPEFLRAAVESVKAQTFSDFEALVVDDAGNPKAEAPHDDRFRVIRRSVNGGQAAALNTGISESRGRYIVFLDDDDLMLPERLNLALRGFLDAPVSICHAKSFGAAGSRTASERRRSWNGDVSRSIRQITTPNLGQTAVERKRVLPFNESLTASADVEWWIRLARENTVRTVPQVGFLYRVHDEDRHKNPYIERVTSLLRIYEIHRDYFDQNRRAAAFHFRSAGLCALRAGSRNQASRLFLRSLTSWPHSKTAWHLVRALTGTHPSRPRQKVGH